MKYSLGILAHLFLSHYKYKFGIDITPGTQIGPGLYIGHFGGIVISSGAVIGKNCNISHGVTIGVKRGGTHPGIPAIGDYVYIGPGAKIIGGIKIGNHCLIGANAVVTKDFPDGCVIAGIPAVNIGPSEGRKYINNTAECDFK